VLRLNPDGTTPKDQASGPIYVAGLQSPRAMTWRASSGALWIADVSETAAALEIIDTMAMRSPRAPAPTRVALPTGSGAASLRFYESDVMPGFRDNLLVAADRSRYLLRVRFDPRNPMRIMTSDRMLEGIGQRVRAVSVGDDGAVYVATDSTLLRLGTAPTTGAARN
jgi:glucose/arabinose dehydrogenase